MSSDLAGQVALVTGATAGIGRATATHLAKASATVIVHGRDESRGEQVVETIQSGGGQARLIAADLSETEQAEHLVKDAGDVDILINNAGVYQFGSTAEISDEVFDLHVAINLKAPFILVRGLAPAMAGRGVGTVVNVSTFAGSRAGAGGGIYGATKAALENLTLLWADEFGQSGVRVNAVAAGPVKTQGTEPFAPMLQALGQAFSLGRVAEAEEIAEVITFLASPNAGIVNGAVVQAHGGIKAITSVG